jgi:hypothetical protein
MAIFPAALPAYGLDGLAGLTEESDGMLVDVLNRPFWPRALVNSNRFPSLAARADLFTLIERAGWQIPRLYTSMMPAADTIRVVRCMHHSRNIDYWRYNPATQWRTRSATTPVTQSDLMCEYAELVPVQGRRKMGVPVLRRMTCWRPWHTSTAEYTDERVYLIFYASVPDYPEKRVRSEEEVVAEKRQREVDAANEHLKG